MSSLSSKTRVGLALLAFLHPSWSVGQPSPAITGAADQLETRLQAAVEAAWRESGVEGVAVAWVTPEGESLVAVAGEREPGVPVTADTGFEVGSISKVFTGALALKAQSAGLLSLDDSLARWLPDVTASDRITLRQLLQHTSGLEDPLLERPFIMRYFMSPKTAPDAAGLVAAAEALDFEPGTSWKYSNTGFVAMALLLEQLYDQSFGDLIQTQLAQPSEAPHVYSIDWPESPDRPLAHGFIDLAGNGTFTDFSAMTDSRTFRAATIGAGSMLATAPALARALHAIVGGEVMTPEELAEMKTWVDRPDGHRYGIGLLRIESSDGRVFLGHRGNSSSFSAEAWHMPTEGATIAALTNRGGLLVSSITEAVVAALLHVDEPEDQP